MIAQQSLFDDFHYEKKALSRFPRVKKHTQEESARPVQLEFNIDEYLDQLPEVIWEEKDLEFLRDALISRSLEIMRNKKANTASFAEELAWFFSDKDVDHPFSIQQCCLSAGLNIDALREGVSAALDADKKMILRLIDSGAYLS